jgi:glycosyltransferase involved in cell wall biosynthesis
VRVVSPGASADHFRPPSPGERQSARGRWGVDPSQFVLAFVGSLTTNKQPETLVEAVTDLTGSGRDVIALLAGRGPAEDKVTARAAELGISERVRLLGYQDARSVLWAADALVLPSRSEGSPLIVVEGMLSGVVVLSTPAGGAAQQLTPGLSGLVFEHGNHQELAQRIEELIDRPELRSDLVAHALDDARERYSSTWMAKAVADTYVQALAGRQG